MIINNNAIINQNISIALGTIYGNKTEEKLQEMETGLTPNGTIRVGTCDVKRGERENYAVFLNYHVLKGNKKKPRTKKLSEMDSLYDSIKFAASVDFAYNLR